MISSIQSSPSRAKRPRLLASGQLLYSELGGSRWSLKRLPSGAKPAIAVLALGGVSNAVVAQSITSAPLNSVPVPANELWAIAAAIIAVCTMATYVLRGKGGRHAKTILLVAFMTLSALWSNSTTWAQMFAQFTQPSGQTLAIPVIPIVNEGALQGFEPADFLNSSGLALRIAALAPPTFSNCFPEFPTAPLPPPGGGGPPACTVGHVLGAGSSCRVDVDAICKALATQATALINIFPSSLQFPESGSATVTVSANPASPQPAQNVMATIPGSSALVVQSTTCPASLPAGAACTITFASSVVEGPTTVGVSGSNTAPLTLSVSVTTRPSISITSPVPVNRVISVGSMTGLDLTVTNDAGSTANATAITVVDKTAVPNLVVDDSDCASVAPGATCTLRLTSSTPYIPSTITVGGSNAANTPAALVAFAHLGGLVFEASGGAGKVVNDASQTFESTWTASFSDIAGAYGSVDGAVNTAAIVADAACSSAPASCAAKRCQDLGADWYLPAVNEWTALRAALCSSSGSSCDFGGFAFAHYSTSTQTSNLGIRVVIMPEGQVGVAGKLGTRAARCVRSF